MVADPQRGSVSRPAIEPARTVGPTGPDEEGLLGSSDFAVSKFYQYKGPNYYLDRAAIVFNLHIDEEGQPASYYLKAVGERFPEIIAAAPKRVADLFGETLHAIIRLGMNLHIAPYSITRDGDEFVIAIGYLDPITVEEAAFLTADWLRAITVGDPFDFETEYEKLKTGFDRTLYAGPTAYSLIEAGLKRDIPVFYLAIEREMQWGYGRNQLRGRSTVLHKDSIKDTEFTTFKDDVKDFLDQCGFPTPGGATCPDLASALEEAELIQYPVVAKPVAGHKGEGVFTNLADAAALTHAFHQIKAHLAGNEGPQGVIVERFITGYDHRLLTVDGKFAAALERIPAYVDGNGIDRIDVLIDRENDRPARASHARAPLAKIVKDEDLLHFIAGQGLSLDSVPESGRRIFLRRVANISAGGVSINVTNKIHADNVALCEDIARFFQVTCLGIDVLAEDISKSWRGSSFAIIEINAGPGVFMHLAPAIGEPIDVPGMVITAHFRRGAASARIPIIAGHNLSQAMSQRVEQAIRALRPDAEFAAVTKDGLHFNGRFFCNNPHHDANVMLALRNPRLDIALFNHDKDDWLDYGSFHQGADLVVLDDPDDIEDYCLRRDILPDGLLIETLQNKVTLSQNSTLLHSVSLAEPSAAAKQEAIFTLIERSLPRLLALYNV